MNTMDYTLLTLSLGLLLSASTCVNSEDAFSDSGLPSADSLNSHPLRTVEKWSPSIHSIDNYDNEDNAIEEPVDELDSTYYVDDADKRGGLFRFGKRQGSLFRFGKRQGSLFRFGKRGSLFRFGKRQGSLFRFGKRGGALFRFGRGGATQDSENDVDLDKRTLFRFGKRSDMLPHLLAQVDLLKNPSYQNNLDN